MGSRQGRLPSVAMFSLLLLTTSVAAQPAGDSLAGKSVAMIIGFGPGGGYDLWGSTVGRHIGRHLPGTPSVVPQNMPGAGVLNSDGSFRQNAWVIALRSALNF